MSLATTEHTERDRGRGMPPSTPGRPVERVYNTPTTGPAPPQQPRVPGAPIVTPAPDAVLSQLPCVNGVPLPLSVAYVRLASNEQPDASTTPLHHGVHAQMNNAGPGLNRTSASQAGPMGSNNPAPTIPTPSPLPGSQDTANSRPRTNDQPTTYVQMAESGHHPAQPDS